jgi:pimeloyl-ACP methyl ester carboxylesterase
VAEGGRPRSNATALELLALSLGLQAGALGFPAAGLSTERATVIFVPGAGGGTQQFAKVRASLSTEANVMTFAYDDKARLAEAANTLGETIAQLPGEVLVIAHSMGALLPMYLGATDQREQFRRLKAIYVNPLIGGSRYADHIKALWWLQPLKPLIQRLFFPDSVRDLAPESDFQQEVFGVRSSASTFRHATLLLFTERPGTEPDIEPHRVPRFFGQRRENLLARIGTVVRVEAFAQGHIAPLQSPELLVPFVERLLGGEGGRRPLKAIGDDEFGLAR